jgi:hypothetical protein
MPLALPKVQEFQRPEWLSYTAVANWPKVRPQNSKGADQNCKRPVTICLVLAEFSSEGRKGAEFLKSLFFFTFFRVIDRWIDVRYQEFAISFC